MAFTGSFPSGSTLQGAYYAYQIQPSSGSALVFASQSYRISNGTPRQFLLTYPIGYSGSIPHATTSTGSGGGGGGGTGSIPIVGQIWPRALP